MEAFALTEVLPLRLIIWVLKPLQIKYSKISVYSFYPKDLLETNFIQQDVKLSCCDPFLVLIQSAFFLHPALFTFLSFLLNLLG